MTALDLINALKKPGPHHPVYFLYGEEDFFKTELVQLLTRKIITPDNHEFNFESFDARTTTPSQWIEAARTLSFLGGDKLVVVRGLDEAGEADRTDVEVQALIDYTQDPIPEACLVMTARKADGKRKLYKHLKKLKGAGECAAPPERALVQWLQDRARSLDHSLSTGAARVLLDRVGAKPGMLARELDKVMTFAGTSKSIKEQDVAEVVGDIKLEKAFALTDALKERNAAKAIRLLHNQLDHGEQPLKVLGMIAWQFRVIWEVKHHQTKKVPARSIAQTMGANPFVIEQAMKVARTFSTAQLRNGFRSLHHADLELKSTGKAPEGILESLVLSLCAQQTPTD